MLRTLNFESSPLKPVLARLFSRQAVPFWTIFLIALLVRIADQYFVSQYSPFYGGVLWPDSAVYDYWAREISHTFWLGWDRIPFSHSPLYPYFLAMLYLRFGAGITVVAWSQRLIGVFTVVLLFWLGRHVFGRRAGWFAGLGAAACPLFLLYESEILVETLVLFLHVLILCLLVIAAERRSPRWWAGAGIALGLCCLGRPNTLLLIPALVVWAVIITRGSKLSRLLPSIVLLTAAAVIILPVTLLNYFVGGHFSLITSSGPCNMYIGNAPDSPGTFLSTPSTNTIRQKENKSDLDINWHGHLIKSIYERPFAFIRVLWLKTRLFWQSGEIPSGPNYYLNRYFSPLLRLPLRWAFVAPLGLLGIIVTFLRERPRRLKDPRLLLTGYLFLFSLSVIIVFVMGRLRLPALAILFLFAGYALAYMSRTLQCCWKSHFERKRIAPVLVMLLLWIVLGFGLRTRDDTRLIGWNDYFNLGTAYEIQDRFPQALQHYEKASALAPENESIREVCDNLRKRMEYFSKLRKKDSEYAPGS